MCQGRRRFNPHLDLPCKRKRSLKHWWSPLNAIFNQKQLSRANLSFFQLFSSFTPDEWEAYSSENIAKAERERKASVALRSEINGILMQTYVDLRNIFETVNNEFSKRIEETASAKRSLEKELARVTHCFVFYSLYLKVAQLSRRRKPGQNNTLHYYYQCHSAKSSSVPMHKWTTQKFTIDFPQIIDLCQFWKPRQKVTINQRRKKME